jgi:ATP-binding protein involved in chromosome partitioning
VDEVTGQKRLEPASVAADVWPQEISPVGRYALHFQWSDGHRTGIYTFEQLRRLSGL